MFRYLPEQASEFAPNADWLHNLITDISVFFTVAIVGAMIYFAIRYRQKDGVDHETPQIKGSHFLEIVWTVVPTIICIFVAYYGVVYYRDMRVVPKDALTINVWAQKWYWTFEYENGKTTKGELVVPVGKPIKLVMKSRDVLHSFFVPAMRIKRDAIPGAYTYIPFVPVKTGVYQSYCTEYCGKDHSAMLATTRVVSQEEFDQWVNDRSEELALMALKPEDQGRKLYVAKGCNACHSLDGSRVVGPSFLKLWGRKEKTADGVEYEADENYLAESILNPNAKIVAGYPPNVMPSYAGQLSDDHINQLIAFIKTLDGSKPVAAAPAVTAAAAPDPALAAMSPVERGKKWYNEKLCVTCHSLDGTKLVGPTFLGIYGRQQKMVDGTVVTTDDAYLKSSILNPMAQVVEGYPPAMPGGLLTEEQIPDLIEFLKTVK
jgi:cytochrome c oxidase subunit 2